MAAQTVDDSCYERQATGACPLLGSERDGRVVHFLDDLENGELVYARRLLGMPLVLAIAHVGVEQRRELAAINAQLEKLARPWYADAWKGLVGALAALGAAYGASKGGVAPP